MEWKQHRFGIESGGKVSFNFMKGSQTLVSGLVHFDSEGDLKESENTARAKTAIIAELESLIEHLQSD